MKKYLLILMFAILFNISCEDEDELKYYTVDIHELKGITLNVDGRSIEINLRETYDQVKSKLPNGFNAYTTSIDFYQINFDFTTADWGTIVTGPLHTITIFNPKQNSLYLDGYKIENFYTDAGLTLETANKTGTQAIYGPGDKTNDSERDEYDSLDMTVRYEDNGDFRYIKISN